VFYWNRHPIFNGFRDIKAQVDRGHDLHFLGSRDVIGHVTIRLALCSTP